VPARRASAKRYAEAVFEIAKVRQTFDRWQDDLASLAEVARNREFLALVESPRLSVEQKRAAIKRTLAGISDEALNLATLVVVKGRFAALAAPLAEEFRRMVDEHRGILRAQVTTAVELDAGRKDQLAKTLAQATGKQVVVTHQVDPAIVGGMVIKVGDRVLDGSIARGLQGLRRALVEAAK
jgi:F-type H+-transporting ATPase subunit delta